MEIDSKTIDYLVYYHYEEFASSLVYANDHKNLFSILKRIRPSSGTLIILMKLCMKYCHYDLLDKLDDLYEELGYKTPSTCSVM